MRFCFVLIALVVMCLPAQAQRVEIVNYPAWDSVPAPALSPEVTATLLSNAIRSDSAGKEWVGCALPYTQQVVTSPATTQNGRDVRAKTALCPEGITLVHTHLNSWDTQPSTADCKNLASRKAPFDMIVMASKDPSRLRVVLYRRC